MAAPFIFFRSSSSDQREDRSRSFGLDRYTLHACGPVRQDMLLWSQQSKKCRGHADFGVVSVRASKENLHLIDADVMNSMKKGAILINIARGSLVDEHALYEAVRSGHLGGAGLDVEEHEPIPLDDPPLTLPQIFITPHQAGLTELNVRRTIEYVLHVLANIEADQPIDSQLKSPLNRRTVSSKR